MNKLQFLSGPITDALGWTLLHALWQGFALVLPVAVVLHVLRNQSSALRYRISAFTLLAQLLASVATFVWYYEPVSDNPLVTPVYTSHYALPIRWQTVSQTLPWHQQIGQFLEAHLSQFVLIYLIGVALFGLRLAGGWIYLQQLSKTATQPAAIGWTQLTNRLQSALAIRAVVQVRESSRIVVPMVVGVLKPILLLPVGLATNLSLREIEAVLAHELAHIKRHDYAVNLLQSVIEVLYFFHPALWWLSARVREEREHCCDDLAVQVSGGDGRILAQALARVEELRLRQQAQAPTLAMAFASKRQHLLHRVRRVLGVQTRPFVSNGSLAGLTLATILLMSLSVYAVQKQDEPKRKTTQPRPSQATRRHKVDRNSEYGMVDGKKVSYIIWKGQKLPTARVAKLQRQLDQVMAGQLNLDAVPQPDRDIMLTIIEKNYAFDAGMKALSEGMAHINYTTINGPNVQTDVPANPANTLVEPVDPKEPDEKNLDASGTSISDTSRLNSAQRQLELLTKKMQAILAERQPTIDRLTKEITDLTSKNGDWPKLTEQLKKQQEQFAKQQTNLSKQQAYFAKQQGELAKKLVPLQAEIARLSIQQTAKAEQLLKQKQLQSDRLEKQMDQLGDKMGELGSRMGEIGTQMQPLADKLEPYQQRLTILSDSISKLVEPASELSEKIGELSSQLAEEANAQAEKALRQAERAMRLVETMDVNNSVAPARPGRVPRPVRAPRPAVAPKPAAPLPGHITPAKPLAPNKINVQVPAKPVFAPTPPTKVNSVRPTPKPAVSPKPEDQSSIPVKPNEESYKGQLARLGAMIDKDTTIKSATFMFKPVPGQAIQIRSATFTKVEDPKSSSSVNMPTIDSVKNQQKNRP